MGSSRYLRPLGVAAIFLATLAIYWPCLHGGPVWDDENHLTRHELRSIDGLRRIWLEVTATQQYYPVLHSAFWLERRAWGGSMLGYHLTNVALHATAACLLWLLMSRLVIPGGFIAAMIFAVHPVNVESVAWITEQKNTLSTVLYLCAAIVYLRFDEQRQWKWYWLAFGLFILALLTKTVTASLPAAMLVVFWWQRGRLGLRRDTLPLIPWLACGIAAGSMTRWFEAKILGAELNENLPNFMERCLIAGRVPWFYLSKLVWPENLMFVYPRWVVDASDWRWWVWPIATVAAIMGCWLLRKKARTPLAVALLFVGTLFPAIGFVNVFPFRYSYVADHFQYLAELSVLAAVGTIIAIAVQGSKPLARGAVVASLVILGGFLGASSWSLAHDYLDATTLYETTVEKNPRCWLAWNNLGVLANDAGDTKAAITLFTCACSCDFPCREAHVSLSSIYRKQGRLTEALKEAELAVQINPQFALAQQAIGNSLTQLSRPAEAIPHLRAAAQLDPLVDTYKLDLADALQLAGEYREAESLYRIIHEHRPGLVDAMSGISVCQMQQGEYLEAIDWAEKARSMAQLQGDDAEAERIGGLIKQIQAKSRQ